MFVFAPLGLIGNLRRQLVAALDAWSYRVARPRPRGACGGKPPARPRPPRQHTALAVELGD